MEGLLWREWNGWTAGVGMADANCEFLLLDLLKRRYVQLMGVFELFGPFISSSRSRALCLLPASLQRSIQRYMLKYPASYCS